MVYNAKSANDDQFTILLNGQRELEQQLIEIQKACDLSVQHRRKRVKKRYYNLALMAKVVCHTTTEEVKRLIINGTKSLLIDAVTNTLEDVENIYTMIKNTIKDLQTEDPTTHLVVGIALEITGDSCRIGRLRNDCSIFVKKGDIMTLTTDANYKYSSFKEICYVINLVHYLPSLALSEEIKIGNEVHGHIVKKLKGSIAFQVNSPGIINSYEYIDFLKSCHSLDMHVFQLMFTQDLELAAKINTDFVVISNIRWKPLLKVMHHHIKYLYNFKLIGTLDLANGSAKKLDTLGIVKLLDFIWLPNLFTLSKSMQTYVCKDVIPVAKYLKKPIIGSVPLERCSDFHIFENHDFLWKIDCIFIEKSTWCNKYPLIVKKLLPIRDFRRGVVDNPKALLEILTSHQSVVNFIIRTISSIECQAIFLYTKCETAAAALGRVEIYCPVYVLLSMDETDEVTQKQVQLAKVLNLRRNLSSILYYKKTNLCEYKPIDFGLEYARASGHIETGDFVITIEVGKWGVEDTLHLGVDEDVVIMRAFYVAPMNVCEKFKC
ncbi:uncharacterized protein LOC106093961 [Stomoxys calcitrans]|uniref:Uncharacterized protein n=1 Tax=Stomoxys calcitrans TaxID=35570 RepID=A0A1I8P1X0_STOCA|nr:uncharacterized protein LOC106093961 [Stomoxys calcitrans]